jgi:membrane protein
VSGVRWVAGALVALAVWIVVSIAFALYVANFSSYDKTYGTLGGVVVFLLWLWLTNMAILLGAEFNAETERAKQLESGVSGAERQLRLDERQAPSERQRPTTAGGVNGGLRK